MQDSDNVFGQILAGELAVCEVLVVFLSLS
jgi:hypothetical protein